MECNNSVLGRIHGKRFTGEIMCLFMKMIRALYQIFFFSGSLFVSFVSYAQTISNKNLGVAIKEPGKVTEINLSGDSVTVLSEDILKMQNLQKINLSHNKNLDIRDAIRKLSKLPKLRELDVSFCGVEELPKEIESLKNLRILKLGANSLTSLPDEIGNLKKLRELIFSQYPDDFRSFTSEQKKKILQLLPNCTIWLVDYFGPVHGHYRLGKERVKITLENINSF